MKQALKLIQRQYKKQFKQYAKRIIKDSDSTVDYFIIYLHYLRDLYFCKLPIETKTITDFTFSSLCTAIKEFDCYLEDVSYIYLLEELNKEESEKEETKAAIKKYETEAKLHWTAFWKLCSMYLNDWKTLGK